MISFSWSLPICGGIFNSDLLLFCKGICVFSVLLLVCRGIYLISDLLPPYGGSFFSDLLPRGGFFSCSILLPACWFLDLVACCSDSYIVERSVWHTFGVGGLSFHGLGISWPVSIRWCSLSTWNFYLHLAKTQCFFAFSFLR